MSRVRNSSSGGGDECAGCVGGVFDLKNANRLVVVVEGFVTSWEVDLRCSLYDGLAAAGEDITSRGFAFSLRGDGSTLRLTGSDSPLNHSASFPPLSWTPDWPLLSPVRVGTKDHASLGAGR